MNVEPVRPFPTFGILQEWRNTKYGNYLKGSYKGNNYEVFNAYKYDQKLVYVSDNKLRWIKSKLTYIINGVKKVMTAKAK